MLKGMSLVISPISFNNVKLSSLPRTGQFHMKKNCLTKISLPPLNFLSSQFSPNFLFSSQRNRGIGNRWVGRTTGEQLTSSSRGGGGGGEEEERKTSIGGEEEKEGKE